MAQKCANCSSYFGPQMLHPEFSAEADQSEPSPLASAVGNVSTGRTIRKMITNWLFNIAMENPRSMEVLLGKSTINGSLSMAMLNNQMVPLVTISHH